MSVSTIGTVNRIVAVACHWLDVCRITHRWSLLKFNYSTYSHLHTYLNRNLKMTSLLSGVITLWFIEVHISVTFQILLSYVLKTITLGGL